MQKKEKVLIIGSGPAGYTAAIYAARSGLKPLLITGIEPGGQLMITNDVENYPGFEKPIQGPWLMEQMKNQALSVGARIKYDQVVNVDFNNSSFKAITEKKEIIKTHTVIISTGAKANWLNIPGEKEFRGFGVSACATCDGFFYKDKSVVVVGGGNTAVEEALFLSNLCKSVTLVHRRDKLRAERILQERLFKKNNVEIIWNSFVKKINGSKKPLSVRSIDILNSSNKKTRLDIDGIFVAIGHSPATDLFKKKIPMDEEGYIFTEFNSTKTKINGIFAAGDVTDKIFRQAVTAAGMGCMSAIEAESFLSETGII